jgi:hypothetical protein
MFIDKKIFHLEDEELDKVKKLNKHRLELENKIKELEAKQEQLINLKVKSGLL